MAVTCTLGSVDLSGYLRDNPTIGGAAREWDEVGGAFADISRQVNVRTNSLIEIVLPLKISAATADLLIAALAGLRVETVKDTNTLHVKPTGATNETHFSIVKNPHVVPGWDNVYDVGKVAIFDLVLIAEPWGYADAAVTSISAANFTLPDGLSFKAAGGDAATLLGDTPAPLTITVAPQGGEGNIHGLWMGWYKTADWTGYLVETDTPGTWVGGTVADAALSNEHGGASCKNTSADATYYPIDTAAYTAGTYRVLARVCLEEADDTADFYLATAAGQITDTVTYDGAGDATWEIIELGDVYLPAVDVSTGAANLRVYMECSSDARYVAMDYVAFVPVDSGLCVYHPAAAATAATSLKFQLGKCYVANICDFTNASGHGIKAVGAGTLVVIADEPSANAATYAGTVTVSYTPRYELWR